MECLNPGGTGKDRAVKYMLRHALENVHKAYSCHGAAESNQLTIKIFEGSSGSTGISLAHQCQALGLPLHIVMPDDQADEKRTLLEKLGAEVTIVPCCSISNENHYVNRARKLAKEFSSATTTLDSCQHKFNVGIFINQFDNLNNYQAHYDETGPEIWDQTKGNINAFVMSAGTGGTIAGVSRY